MRSWLDNQPQRRDHWRQKTGDAWKTNPGSCGVQNGGEDRPPCLLVQWSWASRAEGGKDGLPCLMVVVVVEVEVTRDQSVVGGGD